LYRPIAANSGHRRKRLPKQRARQPTHRTWCRLWHGLNRARGRHAVGSDPYGRAQRRPFAAETAYAQAEAGRRQAQLAHIQLGDRRAGRPANTLHQREVPRLTRFWFTRPMHNPSSSAMGVTSWSSG
jgi:hypothetical protein